MTATTDHRFDVGDQVHLVTELADDWGNDRGREPGPGIILTKLDDGYCGLCDYYQQVCPGPWYDVAFPASMDGSYAEHELIPNL